MNETNLLQKDINEIRKFINFVFDYTNQDFFIELRVIDKNGKVQQNFFQPFELDGLEFEFFIKKNLNNNIYFGILPRISKKGTSEAVKFGRFLYCDFDLHYLENPSREVLNEKLNDFYHFLEEKFVAPNIIIFTGRGFQLYWKLDETLPIKELILLEEKLLDFLTEQFPKEIDKKVKDPARVFRLPNTFNVKYSQPIKTEIVKFTSLPVPVHYISQILQEQKIKPEEVEKLEEIKEKYLRKLPLKVRDDIVKFFSQIWFKGYRNSLQIYLTGLLMKNGISLQQAYNIIEQICRLTNDEEMKHRLRNVEYHYKDRAKLEEDLKGVSGIVETIYEILRDNEREFLEQHVASLGFDLNKSWVLKYKDLFEKGKILRDDIENLIKRKRRKWKLTLDIFKIEEDISERLFSAADLLTMEKKKVEYVVEDLLPKGGILILAGAPESFKSMFALYLSVCISQGYKFFNFPTKKSKVLYIDSENSKEIVADRLKYLIETLPYKENLYFFFGNIKERSKLLKLSENYDVVIFDSFRRFLGGSEIDSTVINYFYTNVLLPLKEKGKSIILIHHLRKKKEIDDVENLIERLRGSSDISAMAENIFILEKVRENIDRENRVMTFEINVLKTKNRLGNYISDFSFLVEKNDKIGKTKLRFLGMKKILTLEDRIRELIISFLADGRKTRKEIHQYVLQNLDVEVGQRKIDEILQSMFLRGTINKPKKGVYELPKDVLGKYLKSGEENDNPEEY